METIYFIKFRGLMVSLNFLQLKRKKFDLCRQLE
jgi:hypothetical protein